MLIFFLSKTEFLDVVKESSDVSETVGKRPPFGMCPLIFALFTVQTS